MPLRVKVRFALDSVTRSRGRFFGEVMLLVISLFMLTLALFMLTQVDYRKNTLN